MDRELRETIWPIFVEEAREHVRALGSAILEMEKYAPGRASDLVEAACRTAHSLKGSAGSVGLSDVERVAHAIEDIIETCPSNGSLQQSSVQISLRGVAAITDALERGDRGEETEIPDVDSLIQALKAAADGAPIPAHVPAPGTGVGLAPSEASSLLPLPPTEPGMALDLWPIFRPELEQQLTAIRGVLVLAVSDKTGLTPEQLEQIRSYSEHIGKSAQVLGMPELNRYAQSLANLAADATPLSADAKVDVLQSSFAMLEACVLRADLELASPSPVEPGLFSREFPGSDPGTAPPTAASSYEPPLQALEGLLPGLTGPDEEGRPARLREAESLLTRAMAGMEERDGVKPVADRLREELASLSRPDTHRPSVAVALADSVIALNEALRADPPAPSGLRTSAVPVRQVDAPAVAAPRPAEQGPDAQPQAARAGDKTIRVSTRSLDSLSEQVEGLLLARARQERVAKTLGGISESMNLVLGTCMQTVSMLQRRGDDVAQQPLRLGIEHLHIVQQAIAALTRENLREVDELKIASMSVREDLRDLRMVTASMLLDPLRITARDVAGRLSKDVELTSSGGEVKIDRRIVDELKDPLLHLVRNAIDHGLENPLERRAAKKPVQGKVHISVEQRGNQVRVVIQDDGKGLGLERIRATAVKKRLLTTEAAQNLSDADAMRLIFQPGFSTAEAVTAISGRGVGLDVVKERVTRMLGMVDVESTVGKGTRFILDVPLTMAATLAMLVVTNGETFALPLDTLERVMRVRTKDFGSVGGRRVVAVDDAQLPYATLADVLKLSGGSLQEVGADRPSIVLSSANHRVVLSVDQIIGQHEVIIQPLPKQMGALAFIRGAAILNDGRIVSVLNGADIARGAQPKSSRSEARSRPRVLVADDSLTTRSMMKAVLELAGYDVLPAADGEMAFELLQKNPCRLVVSDVQMPHLDGLGLTKRIRSDAALSKLPVILVTSLDSQDDRAAGLEAGADGYLVKREVERGQLLELVRQLMPEDA
jgi:two-component system, chemotaxis family, sensor kinase CheA